MWPVKLESAMVDGGLTAEVLFAPCQSAAQREMQMNLEQLDEREHGKYKSSDSETPVRRGRGDGDSWRSIKMAGLLVFLALAGRAEDIKLITLDPGHFHAALFQREMLPGVAPTAYVYAPLGPDLTAHLNRVAQFNLRRDDPTHWQLEIHTCPDPLQRMLAERRGNVVVLSGNNREKIDRIEASVRAGLNVLADKPWIIEPEAFPKLQAALDTADRRRVIAYDAMTERFEVSCQLQRELVNDQEVFGEPLKGTPDDPGVRVESMHYVMKEVAGVPISRPVWFFDIRQQGEGLTDVGTHLIERAQWTLFPDSAIDHQRDIVVLSGTRWPTVLTRAQFQRVTGAAEFPDFLHDAVKGDQLDYFCNNSVTYTLRGIHVKAGVSWEFEATGGGKDSVLAVFRGSKSRIEARSGKAEQYRPELFVIPASANDRPAVRDALQRRIESLQKTYPGVALEEQAGNLHLLIPDALRVGHEIHFALVCRRFLDYVRDPKLLPSWEKPNMLAKYYVTTKGIELARKSNLKTSNQ
jgi:predicted dehydrogenase